MGGDRERPLDSKGQRQAEELAARSLYAGVGAVVSSPAVRCVETVEPLATRLGLDVALDERLYEGGRPDIVFELAAQLGPNIVICSHGDLIPEALRLLQLRGAELMGPHMVEKASTWSVDFEADRPVRAVHTAAP